MAIQHLHVLVFVLAAASSMVGVSLAGRPIGKAVSSSSSAHLLSAVCSSSALICLSDDLLRQTAESDVADAARLRDASIVTVNDLQRDFFLETAMVAGAKMTLDGNLHDPAPRREFLTSSAVAKLPSLTSSNALTLMQHFGVARDSTEATDVATAAYLCGSAALPGESRACAASTESVATFVAAELGHEVKVYSTSGAPASAPASKEPVAILDVAKGSVAEGKKIVVCHHIAFPVALYYCHRVTGTKIIQATLKPEGSESTRIKAVAICHINTAQWLSRHPAFKALKIAHGDEACHMLVENDIVFAPAMSKDV